MAVQDIVKTYFSNDKVSDDLWSIAYSLIGSGVAMALVGLYGVWEYDGMLFICSGILASLGSLFGLGGIAIIELGQIKIPADPASVGVLTIWGERQEVMVPEGDRLRAPYWPLKIDYIIVPVVERNFEGTYTDVQCKASEDDLAVHGSTDSKKVIAGAKVTVKVAVTIGPNTDTKSDPRKLIKFLNHGGLDAIWKILEDMIGEGVRHVAILYDWEQFVALKAQLAAALLVKVTDADFRKITRVDGKITPEDYKMTPEHYKTLPIVDPFEYFFGEEHRSPTKDELHCRTQEIEIFLRIARENGVSDVFDLGLRISRLNVPHIVAQGSVDTGADAAAVEKKEREKETWDQETEIMLINRYIAESAKSGKKMTFQEAQRELQVSRGRATKTIIDGSSSPIVDAAAILGQRK